SRPSSPPLLRRKPRLSSIGSSPRSSACRWVSPSTRNCACRRWRRCSPTSAPRLVPGGALMGQAPRRDAAACAGTGASQGGGLRRLRHHPRLGAHRSPLGGRRPGGVGLGGGHRRSLGALVLLLAPPAEMEFPSIRRIRSDTAAPARHSPDRKPQRFLLVLS